MGTEALLLDTHLWIWLVFDERERTSKSAWDTLVSAMERQRVGISEISFWEIALKAGKGKLEISEPRAWLQRASKAPGIGVIQVDRETLVESALLDFKHRDPADRVLIATALRYDLRLVTADDLILQYAQSNPRLAVLDARPCRNPGINL